MSGLAVPIATAKSLVDQIQAIREERDALRLQLVAERAERMTVADELASLRARGVEYLAALDANDEAVGWSYRMVNKATHKEIGARLASAREALRAAEAALRAEVNRG